MKMTCDVIRDLLPLYAEGLASESSKKLVEEHLEQCEDCRRVLEEMKKPPMVPTEEPAIGNVRREIVKRRWLAVGCAVLLVCAIGCGVLNWLTSPIYLDESVVTAVTQELEDAVTVHLSAAAAGVDTFRFEVDHGEEGEVLTVWTSRYLEMTCREPEPRTMKLNRVDPIRLYYFTGRDGEENLLLWSGPEVSGGMMTLPRLFLSFYFLMSLLLGGVTLAAAALLRKRRAGKVLAGAGTFFWCYALCQGIISGFSFTSYYATREFLWALAMTVFLWGAGMLGWKMAKR